MKDPLAGLERVASVTGERLIVATAVDLVGLLKRPAAAFYPDNELNDDPTNWWGLNPSAVMAMLRTVGFARVRTYTPAYPSLPGRVLRAARHRLKRGDPFWRIMSQAWAVFHAWR